MKSSLTTPVHPQAQDLRRVIGFFGGTAVIVGITIGSGIFRTPPNDRKPGSASGTMPEAPRPFRTPAYPWVPLFFVLGTIVGVSAIVWGQIKVGNFAPIYDLGIAAAGFPAHHIWKRLKRSA